MELSYDIQRTGNIISLLIPARKYKIFYAITKEEVLPAIEDFSCRLLLILENISFDSLADFFCLTARETEILVNTLLQKKLAVLNEDGLLTPSSLLLNKSNISTEKENSLIKFDEESSSVNFDLLTLRILPNIRYSEDKFGLLEIPTNESQINPSINKIIEEFSSQFKTFLNFNKKSKRDIDSTKLYKIMHCEKEKYVHIPLDIEFRLSPTDEGVPDITRFVKESSKFSYILSNDLEAQISDFLNSLKPNPDYGLSFKSLLEYFYDDVLIKYLDNNKFNFSLWISNRDKKLTGYGNKLTKGIIGPIYLEPNANIFFKELGSLIANDNSNSSKYAYWLTSSTPLWGANGSDLRKFNEGIKEILSKLNNPIEQITFFSTEYKDKLKNRYGNRISNAVTFVNATQSDNVEILYIPNLIALVQYHLPPDPDSSLTVPIGFITTDPDKLELVRKLVNERISSGPIPRKEWGDFTIEDLFDEEDLIKMRGKFKTIKTIKKVKRFNIKPQ